jgi:hypothetical protein
MAIIVVNVATPNTTATNIEPAMLASAAGYIKSGIRGSHGPNTKIKNTIHGVTTPDCLAAACTWACSVSCVCV